MCAIIMSTRNTKIKCLHINFHEKVNLKSYLFSILKKMLHVHVVMRRDMFLIHKAILYIFVGCFVQTS